MVFSDRWKIGYGWFQALECGGEEKGWMTRVNECNEGLWENEGRNRLLSP